MRILYCVGLNERGGDYLSPPFAKIGLWVNWHILRRHSRDLYH